MSDRILLLEVLQQTLAATKRVQQRFAPVDSVAFLTGSAQGMEKLDALCMLLIAIGESIKNIDKITRGKLLVEYPQVDWRGVKGMRDILSHHYFDVDAEQIFWVCSNNIESLGETLETIIADLQKDQSGT
jgi:uncharacterized protein with HEPN domain